MTEFNKFFSPESLVLIGASNDPRKWGFRILANILMGGYKGRIYPINPVRDEILGKKVYKSMADVPESPDLAVIVVPPPSMLCAEIRPPWAATSARAMASPSPVPPLIRSRDDSTR